MLRKFINRLATSTHAPVVHESISGVEEADRLLARGDEAETQGRLQEACEHYRRAVEAAPGYAKPHVNLGVALEALGDALGAAHAYEAALAIDPANAYASYNLGKLCYGGGDLPYAEALIRTALKHKPEFPEAQVVLSSVYESQGHLKDAAEALEAALEQRPDWAGALLNYGMVLKKLGRLSEAESALSRARAIEPGNPQVAYELALLFEARGALREAEAMFHSVLERKPAYAEAHAALGAVYKSLGKFHNAERCLRSAVSLNPNYAGAYYLLGDLLFNQGDRTGAIKAFDTALTLEPGFFRARWARVMAQVPAVYSTPDEVGPSRAAFGRHLTDLQEWLASNTAASGHEAVGAIPPFYLAYTEENNRDLLALHGQLCTLVMNAWTQTLEPAASTPVRRDRIEISIVSAHIFDHSVWNAIIKGWIKHLDTRRFNLSFFHLSRNFDAETEFARARSSYFEDGDRPLEDWVRCIRSHRPDVLIYAEVGMDPLPLKLASLRLAPVQVATWGHPETTGLPTIDYYISAERLEPESSDGCYTESLIKLPRLGVCYEPLPIQPDAVDLPALGIDGRNPILISPGTSFKYSPRYDWVYASIARRLGDCCLIFFSGIGEGLAETVRHRLEKVFAVSGLDFDRQVKFVPWLSRAKFHGLLRRADVFLDPIGFSGFNTALEAVECGLPIVTREGRFMRGRLAGGILECMALHELIAKTEEQYVDLAVKLASDADYRACMRTRVLEQRMTLYNDIAPVRALEEFLEGVVTACA